MKISIITITYNSKHYLSEAMESVLSQSDIELEYIIIDGASTDGTLEIIKQYAANDPRIRWISERDDGISDAFNKGIQFVTGDLIGILNSDDRYADGVLAIVANSAKKHTEYSVFHGNMIRYDGDTPLFMLKPSSVEKNIWHEMPLNHPATFVKRQAYLTTGKFDINLKIAMDYDMMLRIHLNGFKFYHIDQVFAYMRYGGTSDERILPALMEVYYSSTNNGYPKYKALYWLFYKGFLRFCKQLLRQLGLYRVMQLHPKFKKIPKEKK